MGSLLRPLGLDAAEQVESTGSVYQRLLAQAESALQGADWFTLHSDRLPAQGSDGAGADATMADAADDSMAEDDAPVPAAAWEVGKGLHATVRFAPYVSTPLASVSKAARDLNLAWHAGLRRRAQPGRLPCRQQHERRWASPTTYPPVRPTLPRAPVSLNRMLRVCLVVADATAAQLSDMLRALTTPQDGGDEPVAPPTFDFWVGRNGADSGGVRLGDGRGGLPVTLAGAAGETGGGMERTLLVEVAPRPDGPAEA